LRQAFTQLPGGEHTPATTQSGAPPLKRGTQKKEDFEHLRRVPGMRGIILHSCIAANHRRVLCERPCGDGS